MGMPALATTDHGYVFGAYEFWKKAQEHGVKPIIGVEAYVTPGTHRTDKTRVKLGRRAGRDDVSGSRRLHPHDAARPRHTGGMHNLFRMSSLASHRGLLLQAPHRPRAAATVRRGPHRHHRLRRRARSRPGCGSASTTRPRRRPPSSSDIFGAENFYCEVMDHGLDIERRPMKDLLRLAKDLGLPLVATNDLHYTKAEDAKAHAALLCVQSGSTLMDPNRFKFDADEFYLKTPAADAPPVARAARGLRQHAAHRRALRGLVHRGRGPLHAALPLPRGRERGVLVRQGGRARPARAASPTASRTYAPQAGARTRPRSSSARATPATSSSSPTSSTGPRTTASGSAPAVARVPARCAPTPCASPTSTRSRTA